MKIIKCILFFLLIYSNLFSQENNTVGKNPVLNFGIVNYERHFERFNIPDSFPIKPINKINSILHFKDSVSVFKWFQTGMDKNLTSRNSFSMGGFQKGASISTIAIDKTGRLIYRNFKTKEIIMRKSKNPPFQAYTVQDNWIPLKWTIQKKYKTILGYKCQKAITQFRGRIYNVWFTKQIPLPYGPWKLFGLPGLILEVHDTANIVNYVATKVCFPCKVKTEAIQKPQEKQTKTLKESVFFSDHIMKMREKKINPIAKKHGMLFILQNPATKEDIIKRRNFSAEKIYSWEKFPGDTPNPYKNDSIQEPDQNMFPKEMQVKK